MTPKRSDEFRNEVVRVALSSGLPRKQVAKDFNMGLSTLGRWIKEDRDQILTSSPQADLLLENERLKRENRILKEEREILKKATQFFAGQKP